MNIINEHVQNSYLGLNMTNVKPGNLHKFYIHPKRQLYFPMQTRNKTKHFGGLFKCSPTFGLDKNEVSEEFFFLIMSELI